MRIRSIIQRLRADGRGQALVETALIVPVVLILLLGAIDFGRAFFGWVTLHQAVRNGANFAAMNPDMTAAERDRFVELIQHDMGLDPDEPYVGSPVSCTLDTPVPNPTYTTPGGAATADPAIGDYANLTLQCDFSPITPLIDAFLGEPIQMRATSTFPVREGCTNCPTPVPATPPPPGVQCFAVPDMVGKSVAGARLAWESAGFDVANFTPATDHDTETVDTVSVTQDDPLSTCVLPDWAIFSSSVVVTTVAPDTGTGCVAVPNLLWMEVGQARAEWTAATFLEANFTADTTDDTRVVTSQTTTPASTPGVTCLDPATTTIEVVTGDAWSDPPETPCRVPNMINLARADGQTAWVAEGFLSSNFDPQSGGFTIRSQSLVGGTYVTCDALVSVSAQP